MPVMITALTIEWLELAVAQLRRCQYSLIIVLTAEHLVRAWLERRRDRNLIIVGNYRFRLQLSQPLRLAHLHERTCSNRLINICEWIVLAHLEVCVTRRTWTDLLRVQHGWLRHILDRILHHSFAIQRLMISVVCISQVHCVLLLDLLRRLIFVEVFTARLTWHGAFRQLWQLRYIAPRIRRQRPDIVAW